jgi:hypothetical protein
VKQLIFKVKTHSKKARKEVKKEKRNILTLKDIFVEVIK